MTGETDRPVEGGGGCGGLTGAELQLAYAACRAVRVAGCPPANVQALLAYALDGLEPWLAEKVARLRPGQMETVRDWIGRRQEKGDHPCAVVRLCEGSWGKPPAGGMGSRWLLGCGALLCFPAAWVLVSVAVDRLR